MEIKCLECGKLVVQTIGKRKKEYCGATCRTKYWKKTKDAGKEKRKPGRPQKSTLLQDKPIPEAKSKASSIIVKQKAETNGSPKNDPQMPSGLSKADTLKWHRAQKFNQ